MSSPASNRSQPPIPQRAPRRASSHRTTVQPSTPTGSPVLPSPLQASTSYLPVAPLSGLDIPARGVATVGTPRRPARAFSGSSSPSPSLRTPRPPKPRAVIERPNSTIYTSFPSGPPLPESEEGERSSAWGKYAWWRRMSKREEVVWREVGKGMPRGGERGPGVEDLGERGALLGVRVSDVTPSHGEGLPKLSRECLIAEIKCYGFYMFPPILVFLGLVLGLGLYFYNRARGGTP